MSTCVRGSKLQPIVSTTKKQLCKKKTVKHTIMQKKNSETHDYAKKDKKHTIMQKKDKKTNGDAKNRK